MSTPVDITAILFAAHRATPHFENYLSTINDLAESTAPLLDPLRIA